MFQPREYAVLGLREPGSEHVGINQMQACREVVKLCDLLREPSQVRFCSVRQRARGQQLELYSVVVIERSADRLDLLLQTLVTVLLEHVELLKAHPRGQDFLERPAVHLAHRDELALNHDDPTVFVVHDHGVDFLVVRPVRDVVAGLRVVPQ